jgi:two-component system sensor histidine kinase AtoS
MIILSGTLSILLLVALLYLGARRKRRELSRQYSSIKSVTDRIFEQMRTGVAVIDGDGVIRVANQALEKIFAVRDIAGRRWAEAMHRHRYLLDEFVAGETGADETELSLESDGESHTLLVARSKLHDDTDDHAAVVMVVYDITRLKEYERESARKQRLSEMGNLAAGVAHEIRNPLNTISIAAQRLAAEFGPTEESEGFLTFTRQIRAETSRLNDIINRFLALAREDQKQRQVVKLDEVLRDIGKLLQVEGDKIGLQVSVQAEPDLAIEANADDLKDLFLNLYNNSKEALRGREGSFAVRAARAGDHIRITIEDSGPGIPPESRDKIFAPYYTSKDSGTGLGLPTAQRIVSDLDGEIRLDDCHANGARFIISIPIH